MARKLKDYPWVSLNPEELDGKIDFPKLFGRSGPVEVEIGCGKGTFLVNQADTEPDVNFIGIEWANKYYRHAVDRIGRWDLKNVRIIRADAAVFIADFLSDDSVDRFHIYFPDPWPKKRHHKRRFFNETNIEQILRCLKKGGLIKVATDHSDYFDQINRVTAKLGDRVEQMEFLTTAGATDDEWVGTNFERKYLKEKRPIYTLAVRKSQ